MSEIGMEVFKQMSYMIHGRHIKQIESLPQSELSYTNIEYMRDRARVMKPFFELNRFIKINL